MAKLAIIEGNEVVNQAAEYLFAHGKGDQGTEEAPKVFGDLTDTEKLEIATDYQKQVIVDAANTFKSNTAQTIARETEADSKHTV